MLTDFSRKAKDEHTRKHSKANVLCASNKRFALPTGKFVSGIFVPNLSRPLTTADAVEMVVKKR